MNAGHLQLLLYGNNPVIESSNLHHLFDIEKFEAHILLSSILPVALLIISIKSELLCTD